MTYDVAALREREFPWAAAGESIYLNHASTGPLPQRALDATAEFNQLRCAPFRLTDAIQFDILARSRELLANLIGANTREIALAVNTSYGINLAAFALPFREGDIILTAEREFPANVYPWMQLAKKRGVIFRQLECPNGVLEPELLARELEDERVAAVTVGWVGFVNGARVDLQALGALCKQRGVYFIVDAIQGLGPLTVDMRTTHVDIFACGAQKWLLSPWGSGFVYVRDELVQQLEPHDVSWMNVRDSDDFTRLCDYDLTWRDDARRFEFITLPFQDFAGMNASLELFHELGPRVVEQYVASLADRIVAWAADRDIALVTPSDPQRRGGIVSLRPPNARDVSARLKTAGVWHSLREGSIRLSPHFYNTAAEIDSALSLIEPA